MERIVTRTLGAFAGIYLLVYLAVAVARMSYPFELEFLEGTSLTQISRLLAGGKLYVKPSLEFIPVNYTPLYYYLSTAVAAVTGSGFVPLRIVSFLASLGSFAIIFQLVRKETSSPFFGLLAAGLFAGCYQFLGAWFDLGRTDSLFLVLLLGGAYLVRFHPRPGPTVGAALLVGLSFFTKQTAAMIAPALVAYALLTNIRQFAVLSLSLGAFVGAGLFVLEQTHDGWFQYYVFRIARLHPFTSEGFHRFWRNELLPYFFVSLGFAVLLFRVDFREKRKERLAFHLLFVGATISSSWMIRSHEGAYVNVLMPACAALSMVFGIGLSESLRLRRETAERRQRVTVTAIYAAALVQFLGLAYNPAKLLPRSEDRQAGEQLLRQVSSIPGEIWLTQHSYLASLAGKKTYANAIAIADVVADKDQSRPGGLQETILTALQKRHFSVIIFDATRTGTPVSKPPFIDRYYRFDGRLFLSNDPMAFRPVTGVESRPELVFVPR